MFNILDCVYNKHLIHTQLKKSTLKKLIRDTCTKTVFSSNGQLYEQIDGVSMGSSMGPLLANIIMTQLEELIINPLINDGTIKFYSRYVDDTLLVMKPSDINLVHEKLTSFDSNLKFTVDTFDNEIPHFLDLEISPDGIGIFRKDTNTGQYININSYTPWNYKTSWLRSLISRAKKICTENKLSGELAEIRKFAAWNGFPKKLVNSIIKRTLDQTNNVRTNDEKCNNTTIWLKLNYHGEHCQQLVRSLQRKLRRCIKRNNNLLLKVTFSTNKICFYTNTKDKTPDMSRSNVVYQFRCPACSADYIGKTDRNLRERCREHATTPTAVHDHIKTCSELTYMKNLLRQNMNDITTSDERAYYINCVNNNTVILDTSVNWNVLLLKEALYIKKKTPVLNNGLKASRELYLFS